MACLDLLLNFHIFTLNKKSSKVFFFCKRMHVFQDSGTNVIFFFFASSLKMKQTAAMEQRQPWTHAEWNGTFFFLDEINYRVHLFGNIWPITTYSGTSQKLTGVLLPCSVVLFLQPLKNTRRGSIVHAGVITYCGA